MTYEEAGAAVPAGLYRHFKGNHYLVLAVARHSETLEPMVVYQALYGDSGIWVRPAEMWNETVERDGNTYRRFSPLSREERVAFYEQIFDELSAAAGAEETVPEEEFPQNPQPEGARTQEVLSQNPHPASLPSDLQFRLSLLEEYYTSGEWREDYEADEAGLLPADLKRGVLSQDGVFDLLDRWQR